jgi:hypothetical protein
MKKLKKKNTNFSSKESKPDKLTKTKICGVFETKLASNFIFFKKVELKNKKLK